MDLDLLLYFTRVVKLNGGQLMYGHHIHKIQTQKYRLYRVAEVTGPSGTIKCTADCVQITW